MLRTVCRTCECAWMLTVLGIAIYCLSVNGQEGIFGHIACLVLNVDLFNSPSIYYNYEECLSAFGQKGSYGSACDMNSDCQLGFVCLYNKCVCDSFYFYGNEGVCKKICRGSSEGLVRHGDFDHQYAKYKNRYTNCTYVDGNLEITSLEGPYDLGFLKDIEEIDGYLLVVNVYSNYLNLTKLRIIRGNDLFIFKNDNYSMYIAQNYNPNNISQGLLELQFKSLTEIVKGRVYFKNNKLLCFLSSIWWEDINPHTVPNTRVIFDLPDYRRQCPSCPANCYNPATKEYHCWGSTPDMCQKLSYIKKVCHESCDWRCFGPAQNQCCHPECAAGCTGPLKSQCLACKNFNNDGECHAYCPHMMIYDPYQMKWVENPDGRYYFGSFCVTDCPTHHLIDKDTCVTECPTGNYDNISHVCEDCEGPCPKSCAGVTESGFLHRDNLEGFRGCTKVEGNLKILKVSFVGDIHQGTQGIRVGDLEVLKDIKEITDFLIIQEAPPEVKNLSFLSGLETIHGRYLWNELALTILQMDIEYIGLTSLHRISNGGVVIAFNPHLCYIDGLDMSPLFGNETQKLQTRANKDKAECDTLGQNCSSSCSRHGCWGPGPDKCLKCENISVSEDNICLEGCDGMSLVYISDNACPKACNEQCSAGCFGPRADQCFQCKNVMLSGLFNEFHCTSQCPPDLYPDESNICRQCHPACAEGCTGPSSEVKLGGCNSCLIALNQTHKSDTLRCLPSGQTDCPRGYYIQQYMTNVTEPSSGLLVCQPCHSRCTKCFGPGHANCLECSLGFLYLHSMCVDECPSNTYVQGGECLPCHDQCADGCHGSNYTNCDDCLNFKIVLNKETQSFACVERCPEHLPDLRKDSDGITKAVCVNETIAKGKVKLNKTPRDSIIVLSTTASVLAGIFVALIAYLWLRRKRKRKRSLSRKEGIELMGKGGMPCLAEEPLSPTSAKPDLSKLRIIKESELRRGGVIGSGAFGMVYKGFWVPQGENVKIPVAIKVLTGGTKLNQHQELLDEARVMASVEHACCVRLLAVCMASQKMMMISQLMPLGCLLGYINKHKDTIGSKTLLNWCTQIARGMVYLEERGIIHRDLAARNILVQTAGQVKITDFGLARLLDHEEDEIRSLGGKVPIRWLAPECILDAIYSHKSDVWSYGVTLWEIFTYGAKPYEKERLRDVPDLIEKGERLPQPDICTIDVYMIMIKCWMYSAESRPSFIELAEEFAKMARDPGRYLVIQGDEMLKQPVHLDDTDDQVLQTGEYADGPEQLIEADEYFKIAPPIPLQEDSHSGTAGTSAVVHVQLDEDGYLQPKSAPSNTYLDLDGNKDCEYENKTLQNPTIDAGKLSISLERMFEHSVSFRSETVSTETTTTFQDEDVQCKTTYPSHLYMNLENDI